MSAGKIREFKARDWDDYRRLLRQEIYPTGNFVKGQYLYRGVASPHYKLQSSFDRWYKGPRERRPSFSAQMLETFRKECDGHEEMDEGVLNNDERLLALAQHYGLPTRLLDWSESPYIAAFFAFSYTFYQDAHVEEHVVVWVLDPTPEIWRKENGAYIVDPRRHGNPRLKLQQGQFTNLVSPFDSLEEFVSQFEKEDVLRRILIPTQDIRDAIADLTAMGIDHAHLFSGFDGYALQAKTQIGLDIKHELEAATASGTAAES